jgi:hypothetical protein
MRIEFVTEGETHRRPKIEVRKPKKQARIPPGVLWFYTASAHARWPLPAPSAIALELFREELSQLHAGGLDSGFDCASAPSGWLRSERNFPVRPPDSIHSRSSVIIELFLQRFGLKRWRGKSERTAGITAGRRLECDRKQKELVAEPNERTSFNRVRQEILAARSPLRSFASRGWVELLDSSLLVR